ADAGQDVTLWGRSPEVASQIEREHRNSAFLPGVKLPPAIRSTTDAAQALRGADLVFVAIPSQYVRETVAPFAELLEPHALVVSLMKGVELGTDLRMSEVLAQVLDLPDERLAVVSGPNLAREIAVHQPTATVVASRSPEAAERVARACANPYFRPYTNSDVTGVELCGAVKNVIALAVGISQGRGLGYNTMATVITRGLAEITRLGLALGADASTFPGLAGMGDLMATCASPLSRNHTLGVHMGKGLTLDEAIVATGGTAEGVKSAESVRALAQTVGVEMPITEAVHDLLTGQIDIEDLAPRLLARPRKDERR
ncbi:MAG: NAD(P)-dependent glycerol-3-phosphate dehydrogenase, partial [Actinomycetales bacterium]|nr:NAD(P)-dependent glycerol-3-phosphate dehydrogenase [Actinomycetales bacterium]